MNPVLQRPKRLLTALVIGAAAAALVMFAFAVVSAISRSTLLRALVGILLPTAILVLAAWSWLPLRAYRRGAAAGALAGLTVSGYTLWVASIFAGIS